MKVSTQGRYGLRALVDLVEYDNSDEAVSLRKIAERQDISKQYLEQLFTELRKANIVKSIRGNKGGYKLKNSPENITVGDVLKVLEGSMAPVECSKKDFTCKRENICAAHEVWLEIKENIEEIVESITIRDLKQRSIELKKEKAL